MESPNAITDTSSERFKLIRNELSEVPFEELHKLQEKLGTKMKKLCIPEGEQIYFEIWNQWWLESLSSEYDEAMYGEKRKRKREKTASKFSRLNKNRPLEMSSKKTVSRFREAIPVTSKIARDPRFDDLSGEFKEEAFNQNYSFLKDVRKHEQEEILKEIKRAKNAEKQVQLQDLLQRMKQKEKSEENKEKQKELEKERRKAERELIKQGKKPFYLKKSEKKKMELTERYRSLKAKGKLDTYVAKRRKKNASKQRRHFHS